MYFELTCPHSNLIYIHNFTSDINECLSNNGGCSHNCINLDGTYICSCPTGYELDSRRKNCVGEISLYFKFLLRRTLNVYMTVRLCGTAIAGLIEQNLGFNWHPRSFCRANIMHHHPVAKGEGAFELVKFSTSVFRPPK